MPIRKKKDVVTHEEVVTEQVEVKEEPKAAAKKPKAAKPAKPVVAATGVLKVKNAKGQILEVSHAYFDKYKDRLEAVE